jgi:hypothetical protein
MPKLRFEGFQQGESVTVAVSDSDGLKGPLTISAWRQPGGPDVGEMTIEAVNLRPFAAPCPVRFSATVTSATGLPPRVAGDVGNALYTTYDPQFHELEFVWSFGGATGMFSKPARLPQAWRRKDTAHGKIAGHVFETAGNHTVTCTAYRVDHSGGTQTVVLVARKTITLTIADPDAVFAGPLTVCIDPDGVYDGAPAGAAQYLTFDAYRADYADAGNVSGNSPHRVLFARGKTHLVSANNRGPDNLTLGAFGTGDRPVLRPADPQVSTDFLLLQGGSGRDTTYGTYVIHGLDFQGPWDEANETGVGFMPVAAYYSGVVVFLDCTFHGVNMIVNGQMGGADVGPEHLGVWIYDCDCTSFRDYGTLLSDGSLGTQNIVLRGTRIKRRNDASGYAGGGKDSQNPRNWHGPVRIANMASAVIQACDFYSRSGWGEGFQAQPCLRLGTGGSTGMELVVSHCVLEGGNEIILTRTANASTALNPSNYLIKHNIMVADFNTTTPMQLARGGTSVVENVIIYPDIGRADWNGTDGLATAGHNQRRGQGIGDWSDFNTDNPDNVREPIRVIGNLIVDLKTNPAADDEPDFEAMDGFTGFREERDNTIWGPHRAPPETAVGPMENVFTLASYNTHGGRWFDETAGQYVDFTHGLDGRSLITPGWVVPLLTPVPGAGGDGAATGPMARFDLLGTLRPTDAAATPVEPR